MGNGNAPASDQTFRAHVREAWITTAFFMIQGAIMSWVIYALGYHKSADQILSTLVFGLPAWYIYGAVVPAVVGVVAWAYIVRRYFEE